MQKFLDQFNLTPMQRVDFENFIYTQADKMLPGYRGGIWESQDIGNGVRVLVLPGEGDRVKLVNYAFGGSMETDRLTASAAFSSCVQNWYVGLRYEQGRMTDKVLEASSNYSYNLSRAAEKGVPNPGDFYRFID